MTRYGFTPEDAQALDEARRLLERPSLAMRLASAVGMPIERLIGNLPASVAGAITRAASMAIERALDAALSTVDPTSTAKPANFFHKVACGASGGLGGFFGMGALVIELPVSTTLMLRSIVDIARGEGEDLRDVNTRLACLEVFALGGLDAREEGAAEAAYYAVRAALAAAVREAAEYLAERGLAAHGGPVLARLIAQVASRFGAAVSEKAAAQAVPVLGAVGGASINVIFIDHFQDMARAHFTIRRLERRYGEEAVRAALG